MPSLTTAMVSFVGQLDDPRTDDGALVAFLKGFANVTTLFLHFRPFHRRKLFFQPHPDLLFHFLNLVELQLVISRGRLVWWDLWILLMACPCLQNLLLSFPLNEETDDYIGKFRNSFERPNEIPNCLIHHLKRVEMTGFVGDEDDMQLIALILKVAIALERAHICIAKRCCCIKGGDCCISAKDAQKV
ncbi:putative FBD-associated F-box protein At5g56820 [Nymphaea colorata]|uniref:putative FBD-associated F-box protein At5g56820 n=1 Tax=Nymphaea colorata TaxID=210225 RepID=UPI00214E1BF5|nr:putative FBD-associated F-box protein At5g56820 [Nymphaea colorata]